LRRSTFSGSAGSEALRASTLTAALVAGLECEEVDHLEKQRRRQVVDAVVARVLQDLQRDTLSGAGKSADDD